MYNTPLLALTSGVLLTIRPLLARLSNGIRKKKKKFFEFVILKKIKCMFQIAAKIGGDGVAAPTGSEFGYGGQKRPLEDAGGYFPMPNLNIGQ